MANQSKKHIHVVFKTHLDIGFTDLAQRVTDRYMNVFIPGAISGAEYFAEHPDKGAFIWTTGSWLIHHILKHGSEEEKSKVEDAINKGYLEWHGFPFTTYTELMDPELLQYGMEMTKALDRRFGKQTIAAKMTDVPGHTRSMITYLAQAGIKYLHLGVNGSSTVPNVPEMAVWRNQDGSEIIVHYSKDYGNSYEREGFEDMLYFAHTHDNLGPSSVEQIEAQFQRLRETYPDAVIEASTLDRYAEKVWAIRDTLPVVEEEIGDSWIHGSSTDPYKLAAYRELLRLKSRWLAEGALTTADEEYKAFCDELIMVAEHTWGTDIKRYLADYAHYEKADFQEARKRDKTDVTLNPTGYQFLESGARADMINMFGADAQSRLDERSYSMMERSWQEQRDYITKAVAALHPERQAEATAALEGLKPRRDTASSAEAAVLQADESYALGSFKVKFADDGSIVELRDKNGKEWAGPSNPIGLFSYEAYSQEDYDRWYRQYHVMWKYSYSWATGDFGKPGLELTSELITHQTVTPKLSSILHYQADGQDIVKLKLRMPKEASEKRGAPRELEVEYRFAVDCDAVEYKLMWFDKDANRLPEASWITFNPAVDNPNLWKMDKLGQLISPLEVVKGGNRNMHAVNKGITYRGADGEVQIEMLDAALVCPGERRLLQFDHSFASLAGGMHVNLHNNIWGTNFPAWYEEDALFRFKMNFKSYV
ncbi:DUF5054 domain-containing protein [Paenibacillus marinisediminis]